ncbi:MAG: VIT and VWA domain-containing protein [Pseudomonadota bacterium]
MLIKICRMALMAAALLLVPATFTAEVSAAGLLSPADGSKPPLAIQDHRVTVVLEDGYAITTIDQIFRNPHATDFEAVYSFPVPEKAAVSGFTYWIDGRPVTGEVLAKKQARELYETEKAAGREAALTVQDSYKTLDISVTPVRAGNDVRVRLTYMQPAHVDTGVGRYVYPLEEGGVDDMKLAFWTANDRVEGHFSFDLHLRSSYPVAALRLPKHPRASVTQISDREWRVRLDNGVATMSGSGSETAPTPVIASAADGGVESPNQSVATAPVGPQHRLDTDIVVYWRLVDNLPGSVDLVAYRPDATKPGTFMMVLSPGTDLKPITEGSDWIFVLDKSGSMNRKLATLVDGVTQGLGRMRPNDRIRIVMFDDAITELTAGFVPATPENVGSVVRSLQNVKASGSTNLFGGLKRGLDTLDADRTTAVLLVTDGVANVGETGKRAFLDLVRKADVRLFTFVMGNSANRPLLQGMTTASGGAAFSISNSDDIVGAVMSATSKVTHEALHKVSVKIDGVNVRHLTPEVPGSLYRGEQLVMFGHYAKAGPAEVTLSARISGRPVTYTTRFDFPRTATLNPELERLWAFSAIEAALGEIEEFGENADRKQVVTDLGVEYGLVTPYTSMVVVRDRVFAEKGIERRNEKRRAEETTAQKQRAAQPVRTTRMDQSAPMFTKNRAAYSGGRSGGGGGGGSTDLLGLVLLLALGGVALRYRRRVAVER